MISDSYCISEEEKHRTTRPKSKSTLQVNKQSLNEATLCFEFDGHLAIDSCRLHPNFSRDLLGSVN